MSNTTAQKTEYELLTEKFEILGVEKGFNKNYIFPDDKNVAKAFSNHPDFQRWMDLYAAEVMSASIRFGRY